MSPQNEFSISKSVQSKLDYLTWKMMQEMTFKQRERWLKGAYYERIGRMPDLDNPRSWTEKICWYRLNYSHPDLQRISDKITFKKYIEEQLGTGYTADLYATYTSEMEVDPDVLPKQFVLKSSLSDMGKHMLIIKDKSTMDLDAVRYEVSQWLQPWNSSARSFSNWYRGMIPSVLAEAYLKPREGELLDYKFYCFRGKPAHVLVIGGRTTQGFVNMYDLEWNRHPFSGVFDGTDLEIPKPEGLETMIEIAARLSKPFPFVRVDMYNVDGRILLGELTFSSGGGLTYLEPQELEQTWGDLFELTDWP